MSYHYNTLREVYCLTCGEWLGYGYPSDYCNDECREGTTDE